MLIKDLFFKNGHVNYEYITNCIKNFEGDEEQKMKFMNNICDILAKHFEEDKNQKIKAPQVYKMPKNHIINSSAFKMQKNATTEEKIDCMNNFVCENDMHNYEL